jgi:hypothetical protein
MAYFGVSGAVGKNKISYNVKALAMLGIRKYNSSNKNK